MGNIKCCIWRPSIIACSLEQPFPGWTDSISAAGGLTILGTTGLLRIIQGSGVNHFDVIPVDICTNGLLVATAYGAKVSHESLTVYNCGTSVQNPITMAGYKDKILQEYKYHRLAN